MGISYTGTGPDPDPNLSKNPIADIATLNIDTDIKAVVVGYDNCFHYNKLFKASNYLKHEDCQYIATNSDNYFKVNNRILPVTGGIMGKSDCNVM